jgi:hypothetical protein
VSGSIDGGGGVNALTYAGYAGNVVVDLPLGVATGVGGSVRNLQRLTGGQGNALLVGDGTELSLTGGSGRNVLIAGPAGAAPPTLTGGPGEDILVGGSTAYDTDLQALNAILAEWARTDLGSPNDPTGYHARINHLLQGGGLNGADVLNVSTFRGNGGGNVLNGGPGLDLFFGSHALDQTDWNGAQGEVFIDSQG